MNWIDFLLWHYLMNRLSLTDKGNWNFSEIISFRSALMLSFSMSFDVNVLPTITNNLSLPSRLFPYISCSRSMFAKHAPQYVRSEFLARKLLRNHHTYERYILELPELVTVLQRNVIFSIDLSDRRANNAFNVLIYCFIFFKSRFFKLLFLTKRL